MMTPEERKAAREACEKRIAELEKECDGFRSQYYAECEAFQEYHKGTENLKRENYQLREELRIARSRLVMPISLRESGAVADVAAAERRIAKLEADLAANAKLLADKTDAHVAAETRIMELEREMSECVEAAAEAIGSEFRNVGVVLVAIDVARKCLAGEWLGGAK